MKKKIKQNEKARAADKLTLYSLSLTVVFRPFPPSYTDK